jgi:SAM-dependent methyltransferase
MSISYRSIVEHYEQCLEKYGDSHRGVDWPNATDAEKRYQVMLGLIKPHAKTVKLLDFGCGAGHLYDFIQKQGLTSIEYTGLDLSQKFIDLCRMKFSDQRWIQADVMNGDPITMNSVDYVIMNGVFTEKRSLDFDSMWQYTRGLISKVWSISDHGIAFNVMSKQVDWERDDLFHLPLDMLAGFLTKHVSRHFIIRNDYGLYEYTTYVYKEASWPKS